MQLNTFAVNHMSEDFWYNFREKAVRAIRKIDTLYPNGRWLDSTLAPHFCDLDQLEHYIEKEIYAWNSLDFDKYFIKGWVIASENIITARGNHHPHLHVLLFADNQYLNFGRQHIANAWRKEYTDKLGEYIQCDNENIQLREIPDYEKAIGWLKYIIKQERYIQESPKIVQVGGLFKDVMETEYHRFGRLEQVREAMKEAPESPKEAREFGKPSADMMARIAQMTGQNDPPRRTLIDPAKELLMDWEDTAA